MDKSRKGLPTHTTSDWALVITVLNMYWSHKLLVGFIAAPVVVVASNVLINTALNSQPTMHKVGNNNEEFSLVNSDTFCAGTNFQELISNQYVPIQRESGNTRVLFQ